MSDVLTGEPISLQPPFFRPSHAHPLKRHALFLFGAQLLLELSYLESVLAGVMTPAAREVCRGLRAPLLAAAGEASSGGPGVGGLQRELERTQLNWLCLAGKKTPLHT